VQAPNDAPDRGDAGASVERHVSQLREELAPIAEGDDQNRAVALELVEGTREGVEHGVGDVGNDDDSHDIGGERVGEGEVARDGRRRWWAADVREELDTDGKVAFGTLGEPVGRVGAIAPNGLDGDRQLECDADGPA